MRSEWIDSKGFYSVLSAAVVAVFLVCTPSRLAADGADDVYNHKCAVCHAKDGSGKTMKGRQLKVRDVRAPEVQKMSADEMIKIVTNGKGSNMDGYGKELTADQIKAVVDYYRGLAKN